MPVRSRSARPGKKTALKKTAAKKTATKKSTAAKKAARKTSPEKKTRSAKKSAVLKTAARKTPRKAEADTASKYAVQPGPPAGAVPPVEEPARHEEAVGVVTHYYSHLGVALVQVNKGEIRSGEEIRIKGHSTDFMQRIESMEFEHQHIDKATAGQCIGIRVVDHAREHDIVYLVK